MAGEAVIGALRADLILNTAQLETGVSHAGRLLGDVSKSLLGTAGAAERSGNVFNGLRAKFDATFAASKQYENALKALERAHKHGLPDAQYLAAFDKLNAEFAQMAAPLTKAQVEMQQLGAEQDRLRARFDPLSVVTEKFKADTRDLSRALQIGALDATQYAGALKRLETNFEFNKQAINGFGASAQQAGFHATNLGFQFQDIAVMLAAGQNPLQLAMQQGMQISGIFQQMDLNVKNFVPTMGKALAGLVSPLSLLTVGAIAGGAALFYWATGADDAGKEADKAKGPVDALNAAFDRHKASAETATTAISELRKQYGEYAQAVRQGAAEQAERDVFAALKDARPVIDGITSAGSEIVALTSEIDEMARGIERAKQQAADGFISPDVAFQMQQQLEATQARLDSLSVGLGLTSDQAVRFSELMSNVDDAVKSENMEAMAAAASEALAYIDSLPGGMALATGSFGDAAGTLRDLRDRLAESVTLTARLDAAAPGAGWMSAAIGETNALISRLKVAYAQTASLRSFGKSSLASQYQQYGEGRVAGGRLARESGALYGGVSVLPADKDRGGGGGSSKLSDAQKALEKTADEVKKLNEAFEAGSGPLAKYQSELAKLDAMRGQGLSDGAYAEGVRKLNEELGKDSPLSGMADTLIDAAVKGQDALSSLENGFKNALANIAKQIINAQLGKLLAGSLGGAGGGIGSLLGGGAAAAGGGGALAALGGPVGIAVGIGSMLFGAAQRQREEEYKSYVTKVQAENQARETLADMEIQLMRLQGRELSAISAQRYRESNAMTDAQRVIAQQIWAQEDLNRVSSERLGIEEQLLQLQGNEAELRRRALDKLDPSNRALQEQVYALRDAQEATSKLNAELAKLSPEMFATALDFARARGRAAAGLRVVGGTTVTPAQVVASQQGASASPTTQATMDTHMYLARILNILQSVQRDDSLAVVSA